VEHCKVFNYAAVARLNKGEYVVKEATMAKLNLKKWLMKQFIVVCKCWEVMDIWKYSSFV
jgi:hypothetical protein